MQQLSLTQLQTSKSLLNTQKLFQSTNQQQNTKKIYQFASQLSIFEITQNFGNLLLKNQIQVHNERQLLSDQIQIFNQSIVQKIIESNHLITTIMIININNLQIPFQIVFQRQETFYNWESQTRLNLSYDAYYDNGFQHRMTIFMKSAEPIIAHVDIDYIQEQQTFTCQVFDSDEQKLIQPMRYRYIRNETESFESDIPYLCLSDLQIPNKGVFKVIVEFQNQLIQSENIYLKLSEGNLKIIREKRKLSRHQVAHHIPGIQVSESRSITDSESEQSGDIVEVVQQKVEEPVEEVIENAKYPISPVYVQISNKVNQTNNVQIKFNFQFNDAPVFIVFNELRTNEYLLSSVKVQAAKIDESTFDLTYKFSNFDVNTIPSLYISVKQHQFMIPLLAEPVSGEVQVPAKTAVTITDLNSSKTTKSEFKDGKIKNLELSGGYVLNSAMFAQQYPSHVCAALCQALTSIFKYLYPNYKLTDDIIVYSPNNQFQAVKFDKVQPETSFSTLLNLTNRAFKGQQNGNNQNFIQNDFKTTGTYLFSEPELIKMNGQSVNFNNARGVFVRKYKGHTESFQKQIGNQIWAANYFMSQITEIEIPAVIKQEYNIELEGKKSVLSIGKKGEITIKGGIKNASKDKIKVAVIENNFIVQSEKEICEFRAAPEDVAGISKIFE
ncbi:Hypothetical_protein [Hexamita inflata]|uniref:Hypothetical_protein n=1 Tax=Hexamita inflata TaxID=28002 RepID=A0ABP1GRR7_9EUKA